MDPSTIAALSTPPGRGGIAVIRVSGTDTLQVLGCIIENFPLEPTARHAYHSYISHENQRLDECVVIFFRGPNSYTGEDLAEISIHSNPLLVEKILTIILNLGTRSALPGEFTFRAFKNGKMDLIQAEAVNELINANSSYYANMKFTSLQGKLSRLVGIIKDSLVQFGIKIETRIEFEEDQFMDPVPLGHEMVETLAMVKKVLESARFNDVLNKGLSIVILGRVNVGKSSLFNALLMEERAITSSIPGTTRDFLQEKIYIDGIPIQVADVAGFNKDTGDEIEALGIKRSLEKIENADAVIFMLDASREERDIDLEIYNIIKEKKKILALNKMDIADDAVVNAVKEHFRDESLVEISVKKHIRIGEIRDFLKNLVNEVTSVDVDIAVNGRQKNLLMELTGVLKDIIRLNQDFSNHAELLAEEVRKALNIIGQLTGEVTPDDILDGIFSQFCIGK